MKLYPRLLTVLLPFTMLGMTQYAQASVEEDGRIWLNLTMEGTLSQQNKLGWYMELQPRWKEEGREHDQNIIRPAINYKLSDRASIWLGYADVRTHGARGSNHEQRWWQQFMYTFPPTASGIVLTSRTRLEQRNFDIGDDTGHRVRQLVRAIKKIESKESLSWLVWNELFISRKTDWGALSGFDQNRAFAGIAWQAASNTRLEIGYVNQYVRGSTLDRMHHVLSTSLFFRF
ncbi:DUF2490 domain-containing protein [Methylobacillus arboreus]|uniref:DUF2490 domain-containing protein n=1 Tax=Methylobacillus arboreus TaxID=755170 RepID=UPI001E3B6DAC|nr:DUF2490 domain-containing protein [Methylobacillus arboreus]MCB5191775.1 DUF2490 domain-containing protein [Methylobacillus arboreus]